MKKQEALAKIAEVLDVPAEEIQKDTVASDVSVWDSMGTMSLILWLNGDFGIDLGPSDTKSLQSSKQILELLREHGKLTD